jgi:putative ABC transport system substrate-binding protein
MKRRQFIAGLGGAVAWPLVASAQQHSMPVIGMLWGGFPGAVGQLVASFRKGLSETGYVEGQSGALEHHFAEGRSDQLPALAADLVRRRVAVIFTINLQAALAAKAATSIIPIVFMLGSDPVQYGLVTSINKPGGKITGIYNIEADLGAKRIELLHKAVPAAETIGLLVGPADSPYVQAETQYMQSAARTLGLRLLVFNVATDAEVTPAFATLVEQQAGAILVGGDAIIGAKVDQIRSQAARFALPTMFAHSEDTRAGGLLSYGPDFIDAARQMGAYTGRILKGEKPADFPVIQPTKFEFVINLKTAKALGLTIPPNLLALADEVIE